MGGGEKWGQAGSTSCLHDDSLTLFFCEGEVRRWEGQPCLQFARGTAQVSLLQQPKGSCSEALAQTEVGF